MNADILIVDDEEDIRALIQGILEDEGYKVREAAHAKGAYTQIEKGAPDLIVLDIWLQGSDQDGMQILSRVKEDHPYLPVLMISGHGTIETAVNAIKQGAYDFIEKPFKADRLLLMIQRALEASALRRENDTLRQKVEGPLEMVGDSSVTRTLRQNIERIAKANSRVLVGGESGTGKEVAARMIHRLSERNRGPFMALNCAILHPERIEEELFGTEKEGVIRAGVLERANGGTLLLDEVSDMPLETQGKIVRLLQDQSFVRLGGRAAVPFDVRVIASTSRLLTDEISNGNFREDLYYRLNVVPLDIAPLRDRPQDVPGLIDHFTRLYSSQSGQPVPTFSAEALTTLKAYRWPGNIRQLRNVVEWAVIMKAGKGEGDITSDHLPPEITGKLKREGNGEEGIGQEDFMSLSLREARESFERQYLLSQVGRFGGNISETAKFVGMERSALHRKLKSLDISASEKQDDPSPETKPERKRA
jgi:two-component system nitrogen regulation response regulator NtrX